MIDGIEWIEIPGSGGGLMIAEVKLSYSAIG
jgi:hypothetical protein